MPTDPKKKKTDRKKLNKLVKKRTKTEDRLKKLEGKKRAPLKKLRTKIQEKKKKRIQKKINANPTAQQDRKNALKKKLDGRRQMDTPKQPPKKKTRQEKTKEMLKEMVKNRNKKNKKTFKKMDSPTTKRKPKNPALRNPDGSIYRESEGRKSPKRKTSPKKKKRMMRRDMSSPLSPSKFDPGTGRY